MLKKIFAIAMAATMLSGVGAQIALAQSHNYDDGYDDGYSSGYRRGYDDARARRPYDDHVDSSANNGGTYDNGPPPGYGAPPPPPPGPAYGDDRDARWRQQYSREYDYQDDNYYRECRNGPDPGGVLAGAVIGGLLGNTLGRGGGQAGATVAGVVIGGAAGAALTTDMNCEDRSYAYKIYYNGLNAGRRNASYDWRNPKNGHRGTFVVGDYYTDPAGFRCATFSQVTYINNRPPQEVRGRACQEPNGTWAVVN
jgi:surface antigen